MLPHFVHSSLTTVALMLVVPAWLLSGTPPEAGASIWPHILYGITFLWLSMAFVMLMSEAREDGLKRDAVIFYAAVVAIPCALAAKWFHGTPYTVLMYACSLFAGVYLVVLPLAAVVAAVIHAGDDESTS